MSSLKAVWWWYVLNDSQDAHLLFLSYLFPGCILIVAAITAGGHIMKTRRLLPQLNYNFSFVQTFCFLHFTATYPIWAQRRRPVHHTMLHSCWLVSRFSHPEFLTLSDFKLLNHLPTANFELLCYAVALLWSHDQRYNHNSFTSIIFRLGRPKIVVYTWLKGRMWKWSKSKHHIPYNLCYLLFREKQILVKMSLKKSSFRPLLSAVCIQPKTCLITYFEITGLEKIHYFIQSYVIWSS